MRVPLGRFDRRVVKAESVELLHFGESATPKVDAITQNVSPRGARVITNSMCSPGEVVRLGAPNERLNVLARVVYCQRVEESRFAVGLRLDVLVEKWHKPPQP